MASNSTASFTPEYILRNNVDRHHLIAMWEQIRDIYNTLKASSSYADIPTCKIYRAYIQQGGAHYTASPTAAVIFNNTGVTPVYSRSSQGNYEVTASGLFYETASCYRATLSLPYVSGAFSGSSAYAGRSGSNNYGYITVFNASSSARCDQFDHLLYEIIVQA